ncbi:MAG: DUF1819 family protein [Candidatus Saccharimonas sp.]|nr:DUF1819 family protein [Candidatus Saccharimonas sp.]
MTQQEQEITSELRRISTRLLRKGALIEDTYSICRLWDRDQDFRTNLDRVRSENSIGARNAAWLREVVATISSRFQSDRSFEALVVLAHDGLSLNQWRDCLLWHVGQQDLLFSTFLREWLYLAYEADLVRIRTDDVVPFVVDCTTGRVAHGTQLSEYGRVRAARDLLLMATDFGLLRGKAVREFAAYRPSEVGFLYVLHALAEREANAQRLIAAPEWRMYLLQPSDVEHELLRLHQFQRVEYHVAGSIAQLTLPYSSLLAYVESIAHD